MEKIDIRPAELLTSIASVGELIDSDVEVDPENEIVVGTLPDYLKRFYTFLRQCQNKLAELLEKAKGSSDEEAGKISCEVCVVEEDVGLVKNWFFRSVRHEFHLLSEEDCPTIGIKRGFQVVRLKPDAQEEFCKKKQSGGILVIGIARGLEPEDRFGKN